MTERCRAYWKIGVGVLALLIVGPAVFMLTVWWITVLADLLVPH